MCSYRVHSGIADESMAMPLLTIDQNRESDLGPSMKVFNRVLGGSEKEEPDSSSNCRCP